MKRKGDQIFLIFLTCLAVRTCLGAQRLDARQLLQQAMMRKQRDLTSNNCASYYKTTSKVFRSSLTDTGASCYKTTPKVMRIPLTEINEVMSLDDDTTLDVRKTVTTVQGTQLIKMQEVYKGRPVSDGVVTLETDEEGHHVIDASGNVYRYINVSFDDKDELNADEALDVCLKHNHDLHHRDNINNRKVEELAICSVSDANSSLSLSEIVSQYAEKLRRDSSITAWHSCRQSRLAGCGSGDVYNFLATQVDQEVFFDEDVKAYPAYMVQYLVQSEAALKRPTCIVNARDARVTMSWDALETCKDCAPTGTGGNEKIGKIRYGELDRRLYLRKEKDVCYLENKYVKVINNNFTLDDRNKTEVASYNCKEIDDAVNGAYSPLLDALFYVTVVGKMFEDWYNMTPLTDRVIVRVHYGMNVSQASWDGRQLLIGDGGAKRYPFVALDIIAHEVGHGITGRYSGLFYFGQWGGLNEAFSDMTGETTEAYLDEADWMIGADVIKGDNPPLRYLDNPEKDNRSISHSCKYYPFINPHYGSGAYNKAFYLLVHEYNQPIKEVFHVFLLANMMYWHRMSDFQRAACDVMKAAYDRGQNLSNYREAFSQVGVNVCDIQDHVVNLKKATKYSNITVSNEISPSFLFAVPGLFEKNVTVTANSSYDDVYIRLDNNGGRVASGKGSVKYEMDPKNHYQYFSIMLITMSTKPLTDVRLEATYRCWKSQLSDKKEEEDLQELLDIICDKASCEDYKTVSSMA